MELIAYSIRVKFKDQRKNMAVRYKSRASLLQRLKAVGVYFLGIVVKYERYLGY